MRSRVGNIPGEISPWKPTVEWIVIIMLMVWRTGAPSIRLLVVARVSHSIAVRPIDTIYLVVITATNTTHMSVMISRVMVRNMTMPISEVGVVWSSTLLSDNYKSTSLIFNFRKLKSVSIDKDPVHVHVVHDVFVEVFAAGGVDVVEI